MSTTLVQQTRAAHAAKRATKVGMAVVVGLWVASSASAQIDEDATQILRSMSDYMGSLAAFSADADVDNEVLDQDGQKLHLNSSALILVARPNMLYAHRKGGAGEVEMFIDGKVVTIHGMRQNVYLTIESAGDLAQSLQNLRIETGLDLPGADLFYPDPYDGLMVGVVSGQYRGSGYVDGIECHHLAFRTPQVDWQIWIQTGDTPLPMKYVITTKWVTAAPQYVARLSNWVTEPKIDSGRFRFKPSKKHKKLDSLPDSQTGEFEIGKD